MLIFITHVLFSLCFITATNCSNITSQKVKPLKSKPQNVTAKEVNFHQLDLRVGFITHVYLHPNSSHLFCETVDVGEGKDRLIVSGLADYMQAWQLMNTTVVVVCNLKPAKFRGVLSQGMILCASAHYDNITRVELIRPPEESKAGHRVFIHNNTGLPDTVLNPKEMVWPKLQVDLKTNDEGHVVWRNHKLETIHGPLKVFLLKNSPVY